MNKTNTRHIISNLTNDFEYKTLLGQLSDEPDLNQIKESFYKINNLRGGPLSSASTISSNYFFNKMLREKYPTLTEVEPVKSHIEETVSFFYSSLFEVWYLDGCSDSFKPFFKKYPEAVDFMIDNMKIPSGDEPKESLTIDILKEVCSDPDKLKKANELLCIPI